MSEKSLVSAPMANAQAPKTGEQGKNRDTYRAPRLVVLGTAVELVQGGPGGTFFDAYRGNYVGVYVGR
jgi:hypothetical protein